MDISAFLSADKSMVIAPAGYGKTHTISDCISHYTGNKKILVLTHTHAGVAALKEKFDQQNLSSSSYHLETICTFALNLTNTYHINKDEIPLSSTPNLLFCFAVEHAIRILKANPIKKYISIKYDHLIVDEYQDCTIKQHQMIMALADIIKTHILGDPLQGIFGFRGESIVDFSDASFASFKDNCQTLDIPWRWNNVGKASLGQALSSIRSKLLSDTEINLNDYPDIKVVIAPESDYTKKGTAYKRELRNALQDNNVLFIHPINESTDARIKFIQQFPMLRMIESIDDKLFYSSCELFDNSNGYQLINNIVNLMRKIGNTSKINAWFNDSGQLKNKRSAKEQLIQKDLEVIITSLTARKSYKSIALLIEKIENLPDVKIYRKDLLRDICKTLLDAERLGLSATKSMERNRNILRQKGSKIQGKGIGTSLLTKGLEFDTVIVLNAHRFTDKKHLYVAFTRCCKKLIVVSNNHILTPH